MRVPSNAQGVSQPSASTLKVVIPAPHPFTSSSQHQNLYADLSEFFTEYDEHISLDEKADFKQKMKEIVHITDNLKKCLFGTDWPLYSQKKYLAAVQELPMNDEERELVFSKNAIKVFGLEKE